MAARRKAATEPPREEVEGLELSEAAPGAEPGAVASVADPAASVPVQTAPDLGAVTRVLDEIASRLGALERSQKEGASGASAEDLLDQKTQGGALWSGVKRWLLTPM